MPSPPIALVPRIALALLLAASLATGCERAAEEAPIPRQTVEAPSQDAAFDVVIVGGGLAGLGAANELLGKRVLLLERSARLGGRVDTREEDGVRYELGALFAYDPSWLPRGSEPSPIIRSESRVGFSSGGVTRFSESAEALVNELEGRSTGAMRFTREWPARRAFFGVIHPGRLEEYVADRQYDWRITFALDRRARGNGELVESLARASSAEVELEAEVSRVEERGDLVEITYSKGGETREVTAKAAIVATPADVATRLLGPLAEGHPVSRVRYGAGVVVVLGIAPDTLELFSYVVSEDAGVGAVLSHRDGDVRILTSYFAREDAEAVRGLDDEALVRHTVERIGALGVGSLDVGQVRLADVRRWETLGTIIAPEPYESWKPSHFRIAPRIFLAGDYTRWDERKMPYGMGAAVESGRRAGREARTLLASSGMRDGDGAVVPVAAKETVLHARLGLPVPKAGRFPPLTTCDVFELRDEAPRFLGRLEEGSIAPYGLLLLAGRDESIENYLRESATGDLWEYSPGYGATSADSALVLEGLLEAGTDDAVLVRSLDLLRERYFDAKTGGFRTVSRGRAAYWDGASADTTALIAHLMQRVAPDRYASVLSAAAEFLLSSQREDGLFDARWFPSQVSTASYAVRFLARRPDPEGRYRSAIERATKAMVDLQREDGSVAGSVTETAFTAMTLAVTQNHPDALASARAFLEGVLERGVPAGEGYLFYWFEMQDGTRAFFDCRDRGRLAEALARAALREPPPPPPL